MARWVLALVIALVGVSDAGSSARTAVTVWAAVPPSVNLYGGASYGGVAPPTGAMITEKREVDVAASGEVKIAGVAATIDPASVQLRDLTDPGGTTVTEQRVVPGATTPDAILARHVGDPVTVVTTKGEVSGVLRAVDAQALVVEVSGKLQVMRRDGYVLDVRLPAGASSDKPTLVWKLAAKKPGKHSIEVTYRAEAMSWTADYLAILDEAAKTIDFSAWATVKNDSGASFDNAELVLASGGGSSVNPYGIAVRATTPPVRYAIGSPVHLGNGESVQVELAPAKTGAKARSVVMFEAITDASAQYQGFPAIDCNALATGGGTGRAEVAVELDVPASTPLPDGRVRLFKRKGDKMEVVAEDQLRTAPGVARVRLAGDADIIGERRQLACTGDERTRTIKEKIEVRVENKGKQAADVIVREFMWRYPVWKIDPADESPRGVKSGPQTEEYRVSLPPGGKKSVTYSVVYTW